MGKYRENKGNSQLLTREQLQEFLQISSKSLSKLVDAGLPCLVVGGGERPILRFFKEEVVEYLRTTPQQQNC